VISLRRSAALVVALLLGVLVVGAGSAGAAGKKSCADQVIADWYGDGRVDGSYPQHCYEEAIKKLPADVQDYSSAKDDIENARRLALRTGTGTSTTTPSDPSGGGTSTDTTPTQTTSTPTTPKPTTTAPNRDVDPAGGNASGQVDSSNASSVPVPLLVLAGLALLLIAAGAAGYVSRRRRGEDGPGEPPPAV